MNIAEFIIEETYCNAPIGVSRALRSGDDKVALLYQFPGVPLPPNQQAKWRKNLGAALLHLENTKGGLAIAIDEIGTPLCALHEPLSIDQFLKLAAQLVESLGQIHDETGFYRHLCDATIFVDEKSAHIAAPHVADLIFEQMRSLGEAGNQDAQLWTLRFIAPEQTGRMKRTPDTRADLYSLGVAFYQMLTGSLPFESADALELMHSHLAKTPAAPSQINQNVPPILSDIVLKLLAKAPRERYQGTFGLLEDLRECATQWQSGAIEKFELAKCDVSESLQVPPRLYGREDELKILNEAFSAGAKRGRSQIAADWWLFGCGKNRFSAGVAACRDTSGRLFFERQNRPISPQFALRFHHRSLSGTDSPTANRKRRAHRAVAQEVAKGAGRKRAGYRRCDSRNRTHHWPAAAGAGGLRRAKR